MIWQQAMIAYVHVTLQPQAESEKGLTLGQALYGCQANWLSIKHRQPELHALLDAD